jgi:uncharacterized protein
MLQYNVAQLLRSPTGTTRTHPIEEEEFRVEDLEVRNLQGSIRLTRLRDEVFVQGQLQATATLECSRCLESYEQPLHFELELEFQPSVAILDGKTIAHPEDDSMYMIDGQHNLDLTEAVREHIILNLPMQPVCRDQCAGLCPICGANQNENPCGGHEQEVDERLAILARLLSDEVSE